MTMTNCSDELVVAKSCKFSVKNSSTLNKALAAPFRLLKNRSQISDIDCMSSATIRFRIRTDGGIDVASAFDGLKALRANGLTKVKTSHQIPHNRMFTCGAITSTPKGIVKKDAQPNQVFTITPIGWCDSSPLSSVLNSADGDHYCIVNSEYRYGDQKETWTEIEIQNSTRDVAYTMCNADGDDLTAKDVTAFQKMKDAKQSRIKWTKANIDHLIDLMLCGSSMETEIQTAKNKYLANFYVAGLPSLSLQVPNQYMPALDQSIAVILDGMERICRVDSMLVEASTDRFVLSVDNFKVFQVESHDNANRK